MGGVSADYTFNELLEDAAGPWSGQSYKTTADAAGAMVSEAFAARLWTVNTVYIVNTVEIV